mmetsp:Transcript_8/g.14  ORF Transcript_8/g.14 Transcript_8/m.14 type:complete len:686 (+) Transcript_8:34-2091(+)|eukprot:CAMPEP_0117429578 /NCGR_PEP_ID=MMETSP0758-20121206/9117_1 /TAXON_ID=63605 /ORGANISM="Percolomonas cosmopolitus, Strain AE-1 (ATCC 50343)" /LENGTH=685 /DNA_ID=CAMNT_0005216737 /DNA_START=30 /DNA_END=2087 /DNA_ORIENTATION=-
MKVKDRAKAMKMLLFCWAFIIIVIAEDFKGYAKTLHNKSRADDVNLLDRSIGVVEKLNYTKEVPITIIHTSDIHAHLSGTGPQSQVRQSNGHVARMATVIKTIQRQHKGNTLTLDGGDLTSGTLFSLLDASYQYPELTPSFEFLRYCEYDATTLGNHEFDGGEDTLYYTIEKQGKGLTGATRNVPILVSNMKVNREKCPNLYKRYDNLNVDSSTLLEQHGRSKNESVSDLRKVNKGLFFTDFIIKEIEGVRIGVFAAHSPQSAFLSMRESKCTSWIGLDDEGQPDKMNYFNYVKDYVKNFREEYNLDMVVHIGHLGYPVDQQLSDFVNKNQKLIDIQVASHTHDSYLIVDDSNGFISSQTFPYSAEIGVMHLSFNKETKKIKLLNQDLWEKGYSENELKSVPSLLEEKKPYYPHHIDMNPSIPFDPRYFSIIQSYSTIIEHGFLSDPSMHYNTHAPALPLGTMISKDELTRFLSDCILSALRQHRHVDFVFLSVEKVRFDDYVLPTYRNATLRFADVYRLFGPSGTHWDAVDLPGDHMHVIHLSKNQMRLLIMGNLIYTRLVDPISKIVFSSNVKYKERWWGIPFYNRLYDIEINGVALEDYPEEHKFAIALSETAEFYLKDTGAATMGLLNFRLYDDYGRLVENGEELPLQRYMLFWNWWIREAKRATQDSLAAWTQPFSPLNR